jgi:hypothetical protein
VLGSGSQGLGLVAVVAPPAAGGAATTTKPFTSQSPSHLHMFCSMSASLQAAMRGLSFLADVFVIDSLQRDLAKTEIAGNSLQRDLKPLSFQVSPKITSKSELKQ